jgi:hypothetical protein
MLENLSANSAIAETSNANVINDYFRLN